ncbi:MAG: response regulator [Ferruginibacter sp.]
MSYDGPIMIVDDDPDDLQIYQEVFNELGYPNQVIPFTDPDRAYDHLEKMKGLPFLIISDIRFPKMDGFEFKRKLLENPKLNGGSIPFVFFTTTKNKEIVEDAFKMAAQGFFVKDSSFSELKDTIQAIMVYWTKSFTPTTS